MVSAINFVGSSFIDLETSTADGFCFSIITKPKGGQRGGHGQARFQSTQKFPISEV